MRNRVAYADNVEAQKRRVSPDIKIKNGYKKGYKIGLAASD